MLLTLREEHFAPTQRKSVFRGNLTFQLTPLDAATFLSL